jgi:hypothetical protein
MAAVGFLAGMDAVLRIGLRAMTPEQVIAHHRQATAKLAA